MGIHWQELIIVLVIALVIFGPRKLPEIGKSLGSSIREFKDSFSGNSTSREIEGSTAKADQLARVPVEVAQPTPVVDPVDTDR